MQACALPEAPQMSRWSLVRQKISPTLNKHACEKTEGGNVLGQKGVFCFIFLKMG